MSRQRSSIASVILPLVLDSLSESTAGRSVTGQRGRTPVLCVDPSTMVVVGLACLAFGIVMLATEPPPPR